MNDRMPRTIAEMATEFVEQSLRRARIGHGQRHGFHMCESHPETLLWNRMQHAFDDELIQQYAVGLYRIDFVIRGVGLEVDGRKFHDVAKDRRRDEHILAMDSTIKAIARVPASAVMYFLSATQAALGALFPAELAVWNNRPDALSQEQCVENYESMLEDHDFDMAPVLHGCEGYFAIPDSGIAYVGSPLCFVGDVDARVLQKLTLKQQSEIRYPHRIEVHTRRSSVINSA